MGDSIALGVGIEAAEHYSQLAERDDPTLFGDRNEVFELRPR
jgi:hypothetical protein